MKTERWLPISGFEGFYEVSSRGRVKRVNTTSGTHKGRILACSVSRGTGYPRVILCADKKRKHVNVHSIVARAFIPNPYRKPQVNHINGIKTDNRVENLEWVTAAENSRHSFALGLSVPHPVKLTAEQVRDMRHLLANGESALSVAKRFGVSDVWVRRIRRGDVWTR